jgi:hypothetical protein
MNALGMQVAFLVALSLPLIGVATLYRQNWFYPAFMVVVGGHYLPFIFSCRIWQSGVLAASLIGAGVAIALYLPAVFSLGGVSALLLLLFAFVGRSVAVRQRRSAT